jgi:hypothetical protein
VSSRRLGRTPRRILPKLKASSQSIGEMMEDVRLLLGLSQEELVSALSFLEKVDYGSLHFTRGNTNIRFQSSSSDRSIYSDISIEVEVKEDEVKRTVEYNIPRSILRLLKKAKKDKAQYIVKKEGI